MKGNAREGIALFKLEKDNMTTTLKHTVHCKEMNNVFISLLLVFLCLTVSSCGEKKEAKPHEELWRECPACEGQGKSYSICPECGAKGRIKKQVTVITEGDKCRWCNGTGREKCNTCSGQGYIAVATQQEEKAYEGDECGRCFGSGGENGKKCPSCNGSGMIKVTPARRQCTTCNGRGYTQCSMCWGKGGDETYTYVEDYFEDCTGCDGNGKIAKACNRCDGRGFEPVTNY